MHNTAYHMYSMAKKCEICPNIACDGVRKCCKEYIVEIFTEYIVIHRAWTLYWLTDPN